MALTAAVREVLKRLMTTLARGQLLQLGGDVQIDEVRVAEQAAHGGLPHARFPEPVGPLGPLSLRELYSRLSPVFGAAGTGLTGPVDHPTMGRGCQRSLVSFRCEGVG
jgi:hypothetical protein